MSATSSQDSTEIEMDGLLVEDGSDGLIIVDKGDNNESDPSSRRERGVYHVVSSKLEDGQNDDCISITEHHESNSRDARWKKLWLQPILPDDRFAIARVKLLDGPPAVKLLKFVAFTFVGIVVMFGLVRWVVRT